MKKRLSYETYLQGILHGNPVILSKAITLAESNLKQDQILASRLLKDLHPHIGNSIRIGISGIPGAGKSTLIEGLGKHLTNLGYKVAVVTIDPSSSISKGSILGDKTRMESLATNPLAYIRTSPSQSHLGGAAPQTRKVMAICEAAGYNIIIVETVGAGQSEMEVRHMTDCFILLLIAGAGDELQAIKKGIVEVSDIILVNKADGQNTTAAEITKSQLINSLHTSPFPTPDLTQNIISFSALDSAQYPSLWNIIEKNTNDSKELGLFEDRRKKQQLSQMHETIKRQLIEDFYQHPEIVKMLKIKDKEMEQGIIFGTEAAVELIKIFRSFN